MLTIVGVEGFRETLFHLELKDPRLAEEDGGELVRLVDEADGEIVFFARRHQLAELVVGRRIAAAVFEIALGQVDEKPAGLALTIALEQRLCPQAEKIGWRLGLATDEAIGQGDDLVPAVALAEGRGGELDLMASLGLIEGRGGGGLAENLEEGQGLVLVAPGTGGDVFAGGVRGGDRLAGGNLENTAADPDLEQTSEEPAVERRDLFEGVPAGFGLEHWLLGGADLEQRQDLWADTQGGQDRAGEEGLAFHRPQPPSRAEKLGAEIRILIVDGEAGEEIIAFRQARAHAPELLEGDLAAVDEAETGKAQGGFEAQAVVVGKVAEGLIVGRGCFVEVGALEGEAGAQQGVEGQARRRRQAIQDPLGLIELALGEEILRLPQLADLAERGVTSEGSKGGVVGEVFPPAFSAAFEVGDRQGDRLAFGRGDRPRLVRRLIRRGGVRARSECEDEHQREGRKCCLEPGTLSVQGAPTFRSHRSSLLNLRQIFRSGLSRSIPSQEVERNSAGFPLKEPLLLRA